MTEQINNTRNKIQMTKDKINIADSIINILHHYTNINNDDNTEQMLWDIIDHCKTLRGD